MKYASEFKCINEIIKFIGRIEQNSTIELSVTANK